MNKITLGATFVAITALVGSPILAEAVPDLYGLAVRTDNNGDFNTFVFKTIGVVPTDGSVFGGYAIPTENADYIVVMSHAGILDSESQKIANDPIWHTHLVKASTNASCSDLGIDALTFEDPSANVMVRYNAIHVTTIANGTSSYIDDISGTSTDFTVGNPIEVVGPIGQPYGKTQSISFDLNVAADGTLCIDEYIQPQYPI